jgi:predicted RecB family nuclease
LDKTNLSLVHGVGKITAERLQASGVNTIPGLVRLSVAKIAEYTGFPPVRAALVRTAAAELLETAEPSTQAEATTPAVAKPAKAKKDKKAKKKPAKKDKKKKADKRSKKKRDNKKGKKKSKKKKK